MRKGLNNFFLITSLLLSSFVTPLSWGANACDVTGPEFTSRSSQYRESLLELDRQVQYAKKNAVRDALVAAGLDPRIVDFIPAQSMQVLSQRATLDTNAATQVATAHGYHPTKVLPDVSVHTFATDNASAHTPVATPSHIYEVDGVRITVDVADYSHGTFKSHPSQEMNSHPRETSYAKLGREGMIDRAIGEYKQANPAGVPLSTGDSPVFYRIVSATELSELLSTGQSRAKGSVTEWTTDFATAPEKAWLKDRNIEVSGTRALGNSDMGKKSPAQMQAVKADFRAKFGREMPLYFSTQAEVKSHFVRYLQEGLAAETKHPGTKEHLPPATKELIERFTHNGVLDEAALGRHIEDKVLSLPPGSKRNDALLDLYGYDFAARLHADFVPGFDEFSPFKGTSVGLPISQFLNKNSYLVAIRDVHGRARKNLGNGGEREWFFKDGVALDEVAGVWSNADLDTVPNGQIMRKAPEAIPKGDPAHKAWDHHVQEDYHQGLSGEPTPIVRTQN